MTTIASATLALMMIAAGILGVGGIRMVGRDRQRGLLMIAAALVLVANVLIWPL